MEGNNEQSQLMLNDNTNEFINEENIDLLQSAHTTEDFTIFMDISTKLMNHLIQYIDYYEQQQQEMLMNYYSTNAEPDYEVHEDNIQTLTEDDDYVTSDDTL